MVSFSCESCGDVLTKKKLDPHRSHCRGATFTCLDCMVHFYGSEYREHTSCISEAQKYQGALYKEKERRNSKAAKSPRVEFADSTALVARKAYVEDELDADSGAMGFLNAPPRAPSPPPMMVVYEQPEPVNVFDFLVTDQTPNASTLNLAQPEPMRMVTDTPMQDLARISHPNDSKEVLEQQGFYYGSGPVPIVPAAEPSAFVTPAPKRIDREQHYHRKDTENTIVRTRDRDSNKDKKRKRHHVEELDLSAARAQRDEIMTDAPPVLHSGLTGGLNRLLTRPAEFPPSPDYSGADGADRSPMSPIKRTRSSRDEKKLRERTRDRGHALALVRTKKSTTRKVSDSSTQDNAVARPRKHRRQHGDEPSARSHDKPTRKLKAIEYYPAPEEGAGPNQQLVLYQRRADLFFSFINKGPESEKGCSVNKVLKRYHRERADKGIGLGKIEEEKELWKSLRLKRNDRGEIVLIV